MIAIAEADYIQTGFYGKIFCEPGWVWRRRERPLEHYDLFYVWDGQGIVIVNDNQYEVKRGSCLLFRPGDYTSAEQHPQHPLTITYAHFSVTKTPAILPMRFRQLEDPLEVEVILARYIRLRLNPGFGWEQETRLILKQLMIILLRSDQNVQIEQPTLSRTLLTAIQETANFIREHPAQWPTLSQLAARARLSEKYFSRMFKSIIGQSVQTYTIRTRLERAEYLLRFGGMQVSEVADALGYRDVFFFSRQFKRYTGRNPSELR